MTQEVRGTGVRVAALGRDDGWCDTGDPADSGPAPWSTLVPPHRRWRSRAQRWISGGRAHRRRVGPADAVVQSRAGAGSGAVSYT
ncbi:hypothetical protein, partial [Nonomuraea aridisoli]|uniref:hypothetical protein n=1 Tax=Nonomuraea aridisoli TaxID=2070368 RepID=UPI001C647C8D